MSAIWRWAWHNRFGHPDHRIACDAPGYTCVDCGQRVELNAVTPTWVLGWRAYWYKQLVKRNT